MILLINRPSDVPTGTTPEENGTIKDRVAKEFPQLAHPPPCWIELCVGRTSNIVHDLSTSPARGYVFASKEHLNGHLCAK